MTPAAVAPASGRAAPPGRFPVMAIIHKTTMSPDKLELLAAWLPDRPWYLPTGRPPELVRSGGFRLDDPEGEVGIEFMVVTDTSGGEPTAYHVPLTYRGAPLAGAEAALVGTTEHGVLGRAGCTTVRTTRC
ncbi:conserved hypothetical protein [Streptomyces sp. Mg1]|nr:conserved hypothetical protein [Streptomyces sp. Mg1]